jgi:delta 1-pyrroline-5-carboxylate dehydrogenase
VAQAHWPRHCNDATPEQAAQLVGLAAAAQEAWGEAEARLRAQVLLTAADRMEAERVGGAVDRGGGQTLAGGRWGGGGSH